MYADYDTHYAHEQARESAQQVLRHYIDKEASKTWQNYALLGRKVDAIKEFRALSKLGLKEAKDVVELFVEQAGRSKLPNLQPAPTPLPVAFRTNDGRGGIVEVISNGNQTFEFRVSKVEKNLTFEAAMVKLLNHLQD